MSRRSSRCAEGRHAFREGACTRVGCGATTTGDLFGRPLDASAGPLFVAGEAARALAPLTERGRCLACGTVRAVPRGVVGTRYHGPCGSCGRDWTAERVA